MKLDVSIQEVLRLHAMRKYGGVGAWARHLGISPSFVSGVLNGNRKPSKKMLADAGVTRVVEYRFGDGA